MKAIFFILCSFLITTANAKTKGQEEQVSLTWKFGTQEIGHIKLSADKIHYSKPSHQTGELEASPCRLNELGQWQRRLLNPRFAQDKKCPKGGARTPFVVIQTGKRTSRTNDCSTLQPTYQEVLAKILSCP